MKSKLTQKKTQKIQKNNSSEFLRKTLKNYIISNKITKHIAVGCSGGVDSMVLLDLVKSLKDEQNLEIFCLHLDHSWHEASVQTEAFLKDYCTGNKLNFYSEKLAKNLKRTEEAARESRYSFFIEAGLKLQLENILLAHNLDDQAETVLFRIIRGSSTEGLKGIPQSRDLNESIKIHRPLLSIKKEDLIAYAQEHKVPYLEDPSNTDLKYSRNRIRAEIIPSSLKINPQSLENIDQLSKIITEEQDFLQLKIEEALRDLGDLPWDLEDFRKYHRALQRKILERTFTSNIGFCNDFIAAIEAGGFHKINFMKAKFFCIRQKKIKLEEF